MIIKATVYNFAVTISLNQSKARPLRPRQAYLFCKISTIITFAARLSFYLDICWTQIDRFLALYWNIEYKERVTNNKALVIIIITKVLNIFLALLVMLGLDQGT